MEGLAAIGVGLGVGLISTVFGLGGGILIVPALPHFQLDHRQAIATSLLTIFLVTLFNTWRYHQTGLVAWRRVPWIAAASGLCAFAAARATLFLPLRQLVYLFSAIVGMLAIKVLLLDEQQRAAAEAARGQRAKELAIGAVGGSIAGFTGVGGGGITTPLLLMWGLTSGAAAAPTSNAVMVFTSALATLAFALGEAKAPAGSLIDGRLALLLFLGAAAVNPLGVWINRRLPPRARRLCLGGILLFICARMFAKAASL